jgi:hypothetical protein
MQIHTTLATFPKGVHYAAIVGEITQPLYISFDNDAEMKEWAQRQPTDSQYQLIECKPLFMKQYQAVKPE